jgi:hypothetical protein
VVNIREDRPDLKSGDEAVLVSKFVIGTFDPGGDEMPGLIRYARTEHTVIE